MQSMQSNDAVSAADTKAVDKAIRSRRAVHAFLPTPIPRETIEEILRVASRAPSGSNMQPWKVTVLTGEAKLELSRKLHAVDNDPVARATHEREYDPYPTVWTSPYIERRRKVGWDLYGLLGITKGDKPRMHFQHGRNYDFFDAPVGFIFTIDRSLTLGSWLDYGTFLQNIMIAARGRGLDTCPQGAFTNYPAIVKAHVGAPDTDMLVCGMALGHADRSVPVDALTTEREDLSGFVRFLE